MPSESVACSEIRLGRKSVKDFFIKPIHKAWGTDASKSFGISGDETQYVRQVDREISEISRKLNVTGILRPKNYYEELDAFIAANGEYDPYFRYDLPSPETLAGYWNTLEANEDTVRKNLKSSARLANAFIEKIRELKIRIELIEAAAVQDFASFSDANVALYGGFSKNRQDFSSTNKRKAKTGRLLSREEISEAVRAKLNEIGYPDIPVRFVSRE